jgi:hypothetical protein
MAGSVVMIVVLVVAPIFICMSGALAAAAIGHVLKRERDQAFEGTEQLEIANR